MKKTIRISIYVLLLMISISLPMMNAQKVCAKTADVDNISGAMTPEEVDKEKLVIKTPTIACNQVTPTKVTLQWKTVKYAVNYRVYRATEKNGTYQYIGKTSKSTYTDKKAKPTTTYYYKIYVTGRNNEGKVIYSRYSNKLKVKTLNKIKKIAYVGDSVMSGLDVCGLTKKSREKVICKIGVNPYNFYNGTMMDQLLDYEPDRMYIMLGMNALVGKPSESHMKWIIKYYKSIIKECLEYYPDMQIVVLPVSPTRPSATVKNSNIDKFNKLAKKMAKQCKVYYYDYTEYMRDEDGAMKKEFNSGDGIHWNVSTYKVFKKKLDKYGKQID